MEAFSALLSRRWNEAQVALRSIPLSVKLTWDVTPNYPHFKTPRGYGVTFLRGHSRDRGTCFCHMQFAPKILDADGHRCDGVIRHELGHVVDFAVRSSPLNVWARKLGIDLPATPELRADAIAFAIWGTPIFYDTTLFVQTTFPYGTLPKRPAHLGA